MAIAAKPVVPVVAGCSASGGKYFATPITDAEICARFTRALGKVGQGTSVELRFGPRGVASARAVRVGRASLPLYEMAVSDRRYTMTDIDRLAADVVRGFTDTAKAGGN